MRRFLLSAAILFGILCAVPLGAQVGGKIGGSGQQIGGQGSISGGPGNVVTVVPTGTITAVVINSLGWYADITIKGLSTGGTYALNPNTTPALTFNVATPGYDSSGNAITVNRTIYGTAPIRQAYPNGTVNQESSAGGNVTVRVALSDDILPGDTVTVSALAGWYTQGTANLALSSLTPTNNSAATAYRPIGAWLTPANLARAAGANMTVEFFVAHRFPRNNGQVAAVIFTASDGNTSVTQTVSSMTQSAYLFTTTCTATNGSAQLTACGNTRGPQANQYVTVAYSSFQINAAFGGEPKIVSIDSSTAMTLNKTATVTGTVNVTLGQPVYVYSATFTNAQLNTLNSGVATVKAVAYPNIGNVTLDTSAGADGTPIAASVITPNLKNLQFYNDKSSNYSGAWAWVNPGGAGGSPAVQTTSADPGAGAYYGSLSAASAALQTYMNANKGHNNACGGIIMGKAGTLTGTGGTVSTNVPSNCAAPLIIDCDPTAAVAACILDAGAAGNRDIGYTTLVKNWKIKDNVTNQVIIQGPDDSTTNPRQAHLIFQNCWLIGSQGSAAIYQIGWREYYNSLVDESTNISALLFPFGATGVTNNQFGSTLLGNGGASQAAMYTSMGNLYSNTQTVGVTNASANYIQPTSVVIAFDKHMNISAGPSLATTNDGTTHSNWAIVQVMLEMTGTTNTQPAKTFSADSDTSPVSNFLQMYTTVVGNRSNFIYESKGTSAIVKTGHDLFSNEYQVNSKGDYFGGDGGSSGNRIGSWRWRWSVGHIGKVTQGATNSDAGCGSSTLPGCSSWLDDNWGLYGNTSTQGYNQTSYTYQAANQNSLAGGNNTGFGYYKPATTTGLTNRVPSGYAGFPGDIEGTARKNDGTGCAGAYEC